MRASTAAPAELKKTVWVWIENRQVMTAAVERGWTTFLFGSKDLGEDWSSSARINPLFIDGPEIFDGENQNVAEISQVSSPRELELVQPDNVEVKNIVIDFRGGWQVTGRGENPPPEFHSLALEWPIKWVKKFYSILILWLHCGFKGSTPGHANSKITMRCQQHNRRKVSKCLPGMCAGGCSWGSFIGVMLVGSSTWIASQKEAAKAQ